MSVNNSAPWLAFITRLHFYIGLFVGPFVFFAALSGVLYVLTPQLENHWYAHLLHTEAKGEPKPLARQVEAALIAIDAAEKTQGNVNLVTGNAEQNTPAAASLVQQRSSNPDGPRLFAVRPAPEPGATTRVMFTQPGLQSSESRAIFIDPITLDVLGDEIVYGTSGVLPMRMTLDYLHRNLLLGDIGRNYSELAASWLWVMVLGGVFLWWRGRKPEVPARSPRLKARRWHSLIGVCLALGLLFFSATGLTWSRWAGANIDTQRQHMGWITPAITTKLDQRDAVAAPVGMHADHEGHGSRESHGSHESHMAQGSHEEHGGHNGHSRQDSDFHAGHTLHVQQARNKQQVQHPADGQSGQQALDPRLQQAQLFDAVLAAARQGGIDAGMVEIRPPRNESEAWRVSEVDRRWPTQVDTVAVDPRTMTISSRAVFDEFPLIAKLIRWGIDAHMGVLFRLPNQLVMAGLGIGLMVIIVFGYRMWWLRRKASARSEPTLACAWRSLSLPGRISALCLALALGWSLPTMGVSLAAFLLVDIVRDFRRPATA